MQNKPFYPTQIWTTATFEWICEQGFWAHKKSFLNNPAEKTTPYSI